MAKRKTPPAKPEPGHSLVPQAHALPQGYDTFLKELKDRIRSAQVKAALAVSRELIDLYWQIGQAIVQRQQAEGWGQSVIDRLAADIQAAFPGIAGFSPSNISRMRAFYLAYAGGPISAQAVPKSPGPPPTQDMPPEPMRVIPWGHNVVLLFKVKEPEQRFWYAQKAIEHGWSRSILEHQITSSLYRRQGKAVTNFARTLPPPQSDLAQQVLKDPYNFDFLSLGDDAHERAVERGLLEHIRQFLLELGVGFAFVGSQVHLEVDGQDFFLDLLFYHLKLRAFFVIDLKAKAFTPEYAGKMNFYLSAVDDLLRHPDDQPSIGLILCETKSKIIAEYALRDTSKPIGVSTYLLNDQLPKQLEGSLPSIADLEAELQAAAAQALQRKSKQPKKPKKK